MITRVCSLLFFLLPSLAQAAPGELFNCYIDSMQIESVTVSTYRGRLFLITKPVDGDAQSRIMTREEWESRIFVLSDTPALRAVLYRDKDEQRWYFNFKSDDGWSSFGTADCGR